MTVGYDEEIPFEKVRAHNKPDDAWCAIHGHVYDVTKFASVHPGGDIILLAAGKEATVLYETYHVRGVSDAVLRKYRIGKLPDGQGGANEKEKRTLSGLSSASYYTWNSDFYKVMRERVVARLKERGVARRGGYELWTKAFLLLVGFWSSLYLMCTLDPSFGGIFAAMFLGVFAAFVGTCIQHDGNHGAFAQTRWVNKVAGWTLDMIGASGMTWEFQHVLGHHPYTNLIEEDNGLQKVSGKKMDTQTADQESDPDVFSTYPMMRLHPWHQKRWYHRFQHIYGPFIFGFMTINKVVTQDVGVVLRKRLFQIDAECRYASPMYVARFWIMKALTVLYMVGLPCYMLGPWQGLKLFAIAHFTCGEVLATMFIVNHIIEGVSYASKDAVKGTMAPPKTLHGVTPMHETREEASAQASKAGTAVKSVPLDDWAAVQCQTSVNWSVGSWFWNHFSGGLNHQIEHHLFPGLSHQTYYHIQDVVESTCAEYGVPYQHEASLWSAYWKMLEHLRQLGNEEVHEAWQHATRA
ncbi:Acyl-lipid 7-3-desaturase [Hondaea fermentalgiana]|uniref:Acyl-lipid 7-3-desaturase n=1 Tax=Hondaea fermentalgiana TaxID=2315210 RepID=A0A2R5GL41_9STRA|nr:Acyl-lipid 7-3-desaturase [Hondaea fermentalgiana]|eukprot:GBG31622.1 Acyl-lipid 7-3-desaturase [Hondaea fermentalgiana]